MNWVYFLIVYVLLLAVVVLLPGQTPPKINFMVSWFMMTMIVYGVCSFGRDLIGWLQ